MNINTKYKFNMKGWFNDSWRHMLASKGISTKHMAYKKLSSNRLSPGYRHALEKVKPEAYAMGRQQYVEEVKAKKEEKLKKELEAIESRRLFKAETDVERKQALSRMVYGKSYNELSKPEKDDIDAQIERILYDKTRNWRLTLAKKPLLKELKEKKMEEGDEFEYDIVDSLTGEIKHYKGKKNFAKKPHEFIKGGLSSGKSPSDFNQTQLKKGIKIEMEHTGDKRIAREIAMDHLVEDKFYYDHLIAMEKHVEKQKKKPRKYMSYIPTYAAGDLPVIAGDAVGTAGAAVIPLIPIGVAAGAVYIGAKSIKNSIKKAKKSKRKYQAEKPFSWLTRSVKKKKVGSYKDSESGE